MRRFAFDLIVYAALVALACLLCSLAEGAPVPRPRPKRQPVRPELAGLYTMTWATSDYRAVFWPSGDYEATRRGLPGGYAGRWRLAGDVLTITERYVNGEGEAGPDRDFSFTLRQGRLDSACGGLRLARVR